jgi:hypothetical protein
VTFWTGTILTDDAPFIQAKNMQKSADAMMQQEVYPKNISFRFSPWTSDPCPRKRSTYMDGIYRDRGVAAVSE